jgi:hypothetical protein
MYTRHIYYVLFVFAGAKHDNCMHKEVVHYYWEIIYHIEKCDGIRYRGIDLT